MTPDQKLERRYRRLLWAYPSGYRAERGDEIVGVLLECASPGRSRPSMADAFDLSRAGLAARLRHRRPATRAPWPDAFAILAVMFPILLATGALLQPLIQIAMRMEAATRSGGVSSLYLWVLDGWKAPVAWVVVVVLLLGRKPRLALLGAVGATALGAAHLVQNPIPYRSPVAEVLGALALPVIATLLLSSPSRARTGVELVGRRGARLAVVAACVVQLLTVAISFGYNRLGGLAIEVSAGSDLVALVTAFAVATAIARWTSRPVARRVAVSGLVIGSTAVAALLLTSPNATEPAGTGHFAMVLVAMAVVPVAVIGLGRRLPRLLRGQAGSTHAA